MGRIALLIGVMAGVICMTAGATSAYTVPASDREKDNLDVGWKVDLGDPANAQTTVLNDAAGRHRVRLYQRCEAMLDAIDYFKNVPAGYYL